MDDINRFKAGDLVDFFYCSVCCKSALFTGRLVDVLQKTSSPSASLIRLCCVEIIRNAKVIDFSNIYFPNALYNMLIMEAIRQDSRDTVEFFMSTWPSKILSITDVVQYPQQFCDSSSEAIGITICQKSCGYFYDNYLKNALKEVMSVIQVFLKIVRRRLTPKLRVLDLCGWFLHDDMVKLLCREIANLSNDDVLLLDDYHIIVECEIHNSSTYQELMSLLDITRKSQGGKINLHFRKLEFLNNTQDKVWQLLQQIDTTELTGMYMSIFPSDFMALVFAKMPSLIALRISERGPKQMLPLHLLPRLRRFGLVGSAALSTYIPESNFRQLEHLDIYDFIEVGDIERDLRFLISVPLNLRELCLNMPDSLHSTHFHLWQELALLLAPTLKILILQNCFGNDVHFASIVSFILPLVNLVYLDLVCYKTSAKLLHQYLPKLRSMSQLKKIALSYPLYYGENYYVDSDDEYYDVDSDDDVKSAIKDTCDAVERTMIGKFNPIKIEWHNNN